MGSGGHGAPPPQLALARSLSHALLLPAPQRRHSGADLYSQNWLLDSLSHGRLLPARDYLLPA